VAHEVTAEELPESRYDDWVRLVSGSPEGSIYALPRYLQALCRAAGGRYSILGVRRGDQLAGGVAVYEQSSRYGPFVAPRPLLYYNGIVLQRYDTRYPSEQTSRHLRTLEALESALTKRGYARMTLASRSSFHDVRPFLAAGWTAAPRYSYLVPLADLEQLWGRVEQNLRRLVKRCEKDGMQVVEDDDFGAFFRLHSSIMERREQEQYLPESAFRAFFDELRGEGLCRLFHARMPDGRAIASQLILLGPSPVCHFAAAATDPEHLRSGVSALLRWKSFEVLSKSGFQAVDLTDAALNPVTHFKSQLGGDLGLTLLLEAPQSRAYRAGTAAKRLLQETRRLLARNGPASRERR